MRSVPTMPVRLRMRWWARCALPTHDDGSYPRRACHIVASTISAARALGGWLPVDMMPSILANASSCLRRSSAVAEHLAQRRRELFRRAIFLQEFGNDVLADHEIGQYHRVHLDGPPQDPGLHRAGPVGRHHRHACQRQFERHGAGFGQRRMRDPERRPLLLLADHDLGLHRPALHRVHDRLLQMRHGRQHQFERHALAPAAAPPPGRTPPCGGGFRCAGFPAAPAAPAATPPAARLRRRSGRSDDNLLGQGMADIAAGRAAQPAIGLGLERQQRQHVIDIFQHRARPAGPPRPDRGRHIVDDRNPRDLWRGRAWRRDG